MSEAVADGRWRRISLELKLPLLITVLLCVLLVAIVWASYREVRRTAVQAAETRLENVAARLADVAEAGVARRLALMRDVASHRAVRAFLTSGVEEERARAALERLRVPSDAGLALQVWSAERTPLLDAQNRRAEGPELPAEQIGPGVAVPDTGGIGPPFRSGDATYYWYAVPVPGETRPAGWIAQLRRLGGNTASSSALEPLLGANMVLRFAADGSEFWAALDGTPAPPPESWPFRGLAEYRGQDERSYLGFAAPVEGTA